MNSVGEVGVVVGVAAGVAVGSAGAAGAGAGAAVGGGRDAGWNLVAAGRHAFVGVGGIDGGAVVGRKAGPVPLRLAKAPLTGQLHQRWWWRWWSWRFKPEMEMLQSRRERTVLVEREKRRQCATPRNQQNGAGERAVGSSCMIADAER